MKAIDYIGIIIFVAIMSVIITVIVIDRINYDKRPFGQRCFDESEQIGNGLIVKDYKCADYFLNHGYTLKQILTNGFGTSGYFVMK